MSKVFYEIKNKNQYSIEDEKFITSEVTLHLAKYARISKDHYYSWKPPYIERWLLNIGRTTFSFEDKNLRDEVYEELIKIK